MPGIMPEKFGNLRAAYGLMMMHPGKKLLFMGQDFAQTAEWNEAKSLDWHLLEKYPEHQQLNHYYCDLLHFYQNVSILCSASEPLIHAKPSGESSSSYKAGSF